MVKTSVKRLAQKRAYYKRHRKEIRNKQAEYRKTIPKKERTVETRLYEYKAKAKELNRSWKLTDEQAIQLILGRCHYCGQMPEPRNGIDRVDSSKGYLIDNTVSACKLCNLAKRDLPLNDFLSWINRLTNWQKNSILNTGPGPAEEK